MIDNHKSVSAASPGRKRKLDGKEVQFKHTCSIRKYRYHPYREDPQEVAEDEGSDDELPMRRARLDFSEQTRLKDGPRVSCLLVKKLIESLVARKIRDSRSFLECLMKTMLACKGTGSPEPAEVDYSKIEFEILLLTSKALLHQELLEEVDQRMSKMIARIERQGVIGVLPGCLHLDKTFIPPLRYLRVQLSQTRGMIHSSKPHLEAKDEPARLQINRNFLLVQM